ncbi:unnamed protein product, partial [Phaeothamnion confervicola]
MWKPLDATSKKSLLDTLRGQVLTFERERHHYIEALQTEIEAREGNDADGEAAGAGKSTRDEAFHRVAEIWRLQVERGEKVALVHGERMSCLEQAYELELLRLERGLDRERILELLRLTDPDAPPRPQPPPVPSALGPAAAGHRSSNQSQSQRYPATGRPAAATAAATAAQGEASPRLVVELERRAADAERRMHDEGRAVRVAVAEAIRQRALREEQRRAQVTAALNTNPQLLRRVCETESRLSHTVLDYLRLRHAALVAQRTSAEGSAAAEAAEAA